MNKSAKLAQLVLISLFPMVLMATSATTRADDKGWYIGGGAMARQTILEYGASESYSTSHAYVSVGYQFLKFLSLEGRFMSASNDTDIDDFGGLFELDTGNIVGLYVRPHTNFKAANVYGIFGITGMDTKYRAVLGGPVDSDTVISLTAGVGGSFVLAKQLTLDVEAILYAGTAKYSRYFSDFVDVFGSGLGASLRYRF